jgi:spore coat protein U-like protein
MMKVLELVIRFLIICVVLASNVEAKTVTTNDAVTVQIVVSSSCTVSANSLSFGNYSSLATGSGTTTVSVVCTNGTPYQVGLNAGIGSGATVTTRKMTKTGSTLNYSLYKDSAKTVVWGNTQNTDTVSGTGSGVSQAITVYAKIPSGQTSPMGSYTDTITATVYF